MAEAFNNYFSSVGKILLMKFPYLNRTEKRFSLKAPTVDEVYYLLCTIDETKSVGQPFLIACLVSYQAGHDKIPNKLLKIAVSVVAPP